MEVALVTKGLFFAYFIVLIGISLLAYQKRKNAKNFQEEYYVGGRSFGPWLVAALSIIVFGVACNALVQGIIMLGCWRPMITPRIFGGHEVTAPCILKAHSRETVSPLPSKSWMCCPAFAELTKERKKPHQTVRLFVCKLVGHVGQQGNLTRTLDGVGQLTLMHGASAGGAAGQNLCALRDQATQLGGVLVINLLALFSAELADLATLAAVHRASGSCFTIVSHEKGLLYQNVAQMRSKSGYAQNGSSPSSSPISAKSEWPPAGALARPAGAA